LVPPMPYRGDDERKSEGNRLLVEIVVAGIAANDVEGCIAVVAGAHLVVLAPRLLDLRVVPQTSPPDATPFDPIVGAARVVPVTDRRVQRDRFAVERHPPERRRE